MLQSIAVTPSNPSVAKGLSQQFTATGTYSDGTTQNLANQVTWVSATPAVSTISTSGLASALAVGTSTISATLGTVSGSTVLTVTAGVLQSIAVTPANPSVAKGLSQQFTATGTYSDGTTQNIANQVTWVSATPAVSTISTSGLASALAVGTSTISATLGTVSGSTVLTVTAGVLQSIALTPANPSVAKGLSQQFTATGTYSDGTTQNIANQVTWASATPAVTTISASGLASALAIGTSTISATLGTISGSTLLTVTAAVLQSIAVTPANPSVAKGLSQQFTATGTYSDGTTQNIANQVTWVSATPAVSTISTSGLASALAVGTSTISATLGSVSGSTLLTVTAGVLQSIAVTPSNPSVAKGLSQQFTATGTYSDGTTQNIANQVTWVSATPAVSTISTSGLASALAVGTSTISATLGSVSGSTVLTVTAGVLQSIAVTPSNPSVAKGLSQQFTATGTYSDGTTQNLTSQVAWVSVTPTVADFNTKQKNMASTLALGTATISATLGAVHGSTVLTVTATAAVLQSITVTPANPSVATGLTQQFTATGIYSDSTTQNLTNQVTWVSAKPAVATINTIGLASAKADGTSTITATLGAIHGATVLTVTTPAPVLQSMAVKPVTPSLANGLTQQFTATGTYSDGTTRNLTSQVAWVSATTAVVIISTKGLATGVAVGTSTISATLGTISGSTVLTVTAAVLQSIAVTPANASVAKGLTQQFTATGIYTDGATRNLTSQAAWASDRPGIATINTSGLASTFQAAPCTISATLGAVSGSTTLTVTAAALESIAVTPANPSVVTGQTQQFTATGTFSDGTTRNLPNPLVTWVSSTPAVATINANGLARTWAVGTTTISAAVGGISASTVMNVYADVTDVSIINTQGSEFEPSLGSTANYLFTIHLAQALTQPVSVNYSTHDGRLAYRGASTVARAGTDFRGISNATVTIPAGMTDFPVNITLVGATPVSTFGSVYDVHSIHFDKFFTVQLNWAVNATNSQNITDGAAVGDIKEAILPVLGVAFQVVHPVSGTYALTIIVISNYPSLAYAQAESTSSASYSFGATSGVLTIPTSALVFGNNTTSISITGTGFAGGGATTGYFSLILINAVNATFLSGASYYSNGIVIADPQLATGTPTGAPVGEVLTSTDQLTPLIQAATANWVAAGVNPSLFNNVQFQIANIGHGVLASTAGKVITLDATADGFGWYDNPAASAFQPIPNSHAYFAMAGSPAAGHMDLLTVLEHELGHILGFEDVDGGDDLMATTLGAGVRRKP